MNIFMKVLKFLSQRVFIFYLMVLLLLCVVVDREKFFGHARAATLSRFSPSFEDLSDVLEKHQKLTPKQLREYTEYYERVIEYTPQNAESYALLGVFYYRSGKYKKSIALFIKSIKLNPRIFWFYYNLGRIYFEKGDYSQAAAVFQKALMTNPSDTVNLISSSKIYLPIFAAQLKDLNSEEMEKKIGDKLQRGYQQCLRLLVSSYYHMGDYYQALQYVKQALAISFYDPQVFYYGGRAAYELKDYEKAIFFFQECLKEGMEKADVYYYLGLSLKELGRQTLAQGAIDQAQLLRAQGSSEEAVQEELPELAIF